MGMFAYMTEIDRVDNLGSKTIEATGHDMLSLLYVFMDEWLYKFGTESYFLARVRKIQQYILRTTVVELIVVSNSI